MKKEVFNNWNELKKEINSSAKNINFHEREIWYASL